ncbi:MAG: YlbF family regulator [Ruminococcaceae bacterium]|nr:YlbF family regulator [Oscillospiraceae bacterium]
MTVKECTKLLGEAIAASEEVKGYLAAKEAYDTSRELQAKLGEYSAQRMLLGEERMKSPDAQDDTLIAKLEARIETLYEEITHAEVYLALTAAQNAVNLLMQEVNGDINFYAFGERPCTHDCSTCHADCASRG